MEGGEVSLEKEAKRYRRRIPLLFLCDIVWEDWLVGTLAESGLVFEPRTVLLC